MTEVTKKCPRKETGLWVLPLLTGSLLPENPRSQAPEPLLLNHPFACHGSEPVLKGDMGSLLSSHGAAPGGGVQLSVLGGPRCPGKHPGMWLFPVQEATGFRKVQQVRSKQHYGSWIPITAPPGPAASLPWSGGRDGIWFARLGTETAHRGRGSSLRCLLPGCRVRGCLVSSLSEGRGRATPEDQGPGSGHWLCRSPAV